MEKELNFNFGDAIWYVEKYSNAYPTIELGILKDVKADNVFILLGYQDYGLDGSKYYEDVIWSVKINEIYAISDYDKAKEKCNLYFKDYCNKLEQKIKENK